jgi:insertion element IS1 protein InsB
MYHAVKLIRMVWFEEVKQCIFYTDDWEAFAKVLPKNQHVVGKKETVTVERDNSNTRHHLRRMTRRIKIVSKKEEIVCGSINLWCALTLPEIFSQYQATFLSIFK